MGIIKDIQNFRTFKKKGISLSDPRLVKLFGGERDTKLTDPYKQISVVYAAVRAKAMNISQVPFKLYVKGTDNEITKGSIVDLFNNVNPYSSKFQLWESIITLLDITGEAIVIMDSDTVNGIPVALWAVSRANMKALYNGNVFTGFKVNLNKKEIFFPRDQFIFNKYYNPSDQVRGQSPIDAVRLSLDSEWGAVKYNQSFFDKGTTVGAVYQTDEVLNDQQYNRLRHDLIASRQGGNSMHEALLLDGGVSLSNTRPSNRDLEYLELRKFTREEVAMIYKVPKSELSLYEDINYATAKSADASFWKKTLIPLMRLIEEQFNTDFLNGLNIEGHFDIMSIDVLNEDISEKAESATRFWTMGVPFNVINEVMNLGFPEISTGDKPKFDLVVQGQPNNPEKNIEPDADILKALEITGSFPKPVDNAEVMKKLRDAKWKSLMAPILPIMTKAKKNVENYFFDVEQKLLKHINKKLTGIQIKAADDFDVDWIENAFSDEKLKKAIEPAIRDSILLGVVDQTIPEETILSMIATRGKKIISINGTAKTQVIDGIKDVLDQAIKEGWTELQRADAINATIKAKMKNNKSNARTIARTETHGAFEEGRYEGLKSTQPTHKIWLSSRDGTVRPEHQIDGETVPFDDVFSNGLLYPLDPNGEAGNVINCRCTWAPVYKDEE